MIFSRLPRTAQAAALVAAVSLLSTKSFAGLLDDVGVTLLRSPNVQPTLTGTGISVAVVEGGGVDANNNPLDGFEVSPTSAFLYPSVNLNYINSAGLTATTFPNDIGQLSGHASGVAQTFIGYQGFAPNVAAMYNYNADFFINHIIIPVTVNGQLLDPSVRVVNQSFVIGNDAQYNLANQVYDNFVDQHPNVLIISGAGNGPGADMTQVQAPATAYNVISVGSLSLIPGSTGTPAGDGRTKVDITAPSFGLYGDQTNGTSFTTPAVSGVATLLVQAGSLGLGGAGTAAASGDARTLKSLLLTGATKPMGWTHTASDPLDPQTGAGIVNAYGSYRILQGGAYTPSSRSSVVLNAPHPAVTTGTPIGRMGWGLQNDTTNSGSGTFGISSGAATDGINHYALNLPSSGLHYALTATLTWNRGYDSNLNDTNWSKLNNLDLFLYNGTTQITASTSIVDNVEQIYLPSLTAGTYDLQVLKHGGLPGITAGVVSNTEAYSLSWSSPLVGDLNWDGVVDLLDLSIIANHWQTNQRSIFNGDVNGDGVVDLLDASIVANNWQSGSGAASPSSAMAAFQTLLVPEPSSVGVLLIGGGALLARRRKKQHRKSLARTP